MEREKEKPVPSNAIVSFWARNVTPNSTEETEIFPLQNCNMELKSVDLRTDRSVTHLLLDTYIQNDIIFVILLLEDPGEEKRKTQLFNCLVYMTSNI